MMLKIGLVGTHQLSFPGPKEQAFARAVDGMRRNAADMGFALEVYEKLVITEDEANAARAWAEEKQVDLLLILEVSYSAGHLVPALYRVRGAKVGIWAIPEEGRSGPVPFNSFCSVNMYQGINAHYLRDYGIRCKWFYGNAGDDAFRRRLGVTVRALSALKKLKTSRVALIGGFAPGFNDLYFDERRLFSMLDGIYLNRLHEYDEITKLADRVTDAEVAPYLEQVKSVPRTANAARLLSFSVRMYLAYRRFASEHGYDALAVSCWPKFQDDYRYSVCSVLGMLNDDGIAAACEGDLMSAVSMLALQEISGDSAMLMDFSAFDEQDDSILLWHCGPGSVKYCRQNGYTLGENYSGMAHEPGKVTGCGVARDMEFDPMPATVFRFSGDMERYLNLSGEFMGKGKESFCGSRGWMKGLRLEHSPIGALDFANTVLSGGLEHHYPVCRADYSAEVSELGAWLGVATVRAIPYADYLQTGEK